MTVNQNETPAPSGGKEAKPPPEINPETGLPRPGLKRLSPTALNWFEKDIDKFILYYVLGAKREPQNRAMAMGSAFDARVKGEMEHDLLGIPNRWEKLFEDQVDAPLRAFCLGRSLEVLEAYKRTGAYAAALRDLSGFQGTPRFEFDSAGILEINGLKIPIYGKPDGFVELLECLLVLDWKLNGFMSQASPAKGYISLRSEDGHNAGSHKDVMGVQRYGLKVCLGDHLREDWKTQLCMYQWMIHPEPHKPWVASIEQLAYRNGSLRVATHRTIINQDFADALAQRVYKAWYAVVNEHYYADLSKEESDEAVRRLRDLDDLDKWAILC